MATVVGGRAASWASARRRGGGGGGGAMDPLAAGLVAVCMLGCSLREDGMLVGPPPLSVPPPLRPPIATPPRRRRRRTAKQRRSRSSSRGAEPDGRGRDWGRRAAQHPAAGALAARGTTVGNRQPRKPLRRGAFLRMPAGRMRSHAPCPFLSTPYTARPRQPRPMPLHACRTNVRLGRRVWAAAASLRCLFSCPKSVLAGCLCRGHAPVLGMTWSRRVAERAVFGSLLGAFRCLGPAMARRTGRCMAVMWGGGGGRPRRVPG
eukprot:353499-Chlamydomonas_euryale.AAC.2